MCWTNGKVHWPGSTRVLFRRHHDRSYSVCWLIPGPGSLLVRSHGIWTTSYSAGKCKSWTEKELTLRGANGCIQLAYCSCNQRALIRRSLAEDVGWDGRLSAGGSGTSELKFDGHLRCTGWVWGGAVWQRAAAQSRWKGRLSRSFGTTRVTTTWTLSAEQGLEGDFHMGWSCSRDPFLGFPPGWRGPSKPSGNTHQPLGWALHARICSFSFWSLSYPNVHFTEGGTEIEEGWAACAESHSRRAGARVWERVGMCPSPCILASLCASFTRGSQHTWLGACLMALQFPNDRFKKRHIFPRPPPLSAARSCWILEVPVDCSQLGLPGGITKMWNDVLREEKKKKKQTHEW